MQMAAGMDVDQRVGDLGGDSDGLLGVERASVTAALFDAIADRSSVGVCHHEVGLASGGLSDVEATHDPRALHGQQHPGFGEKAAPHIVVPAPVVGEDLDSDRAVEDVVEGEPHRGERAGTQDTLQSVGSNHLAVRHAAESRRP